MVDTAYTQIALAPQEKPSELTTPKNEESKDDSEFHMFGEDGFTFLDFVDMVNPLQHIPVVSTAYRHLTGDEIDPGSRMAGGTLFGGPIGLAASAFNVILEHNTGKDVGDHVLALFDGEDASPENQTMMAKNENPALSGVTSGFAPLNVPQSEADAFAAGEASLRLAELQEFMNPSLAQEVPQATSAPGTAGSVGTWAPPQNQPNPFVPVQPPSDVPTLNTTTLYQAPPPVNTVQPTNVAKTKQYEGFQAKQNYDQSSMDALRAFARDMKAQTAQQQTQQVSEPPNRVATSPSDLSQTTDNAWFTQMMSQNMDRYQHPNKPQS